MPSGTTTVDLNLRAGPGTEFAVLTVLPPQMPVSGLGEQGDWLQVTAQGQTGWVHRSFVRLDAQGADPGPLAPPAAQAIVLPANAGSGERQAAKYGSLMQSVFDTFRRLKPA